MSIRLYLASRCGTLDRVISGESSWRLGHRPALDGLRGIAVLMVVGYHAVVLAFGQAKLGAAAGAVGVSMFFALSGFLITSHLLAELEQTGRLDLPAFYARRARRLIPALVALIAACALVAALFRPGFVRPDSALASLLYVQNWWGIAHVDGRDALNHTWSLAIEEQFYLVWPVVLVVLARLGGRRTVVAFAAAGGLGAVALRQWLWIRGDGAGGWRIYAGSDTRADSLLIGCALAVLMGRVVVERRRPVAIYGGLFGIVITANMVQWGYLVVAPLVSGLCAAAVIFGAAQGGRSSLLGGRCLTWVGKRSYGLYLWHVPLMALVPVGIVWPGRVVAFIAVAFALTALSWRYVEQPFTRRRSGGLVLTIDRDVVARAP